MFIDDVIKELRIALHNNAAVQDRLFEAAAQSDNVDHALQTSVMVSKNIRDALSAAESMKRLKEGG